ncbi:lipase secretion chaperone [Trinickia terrae]|uniref:lipase secretion chaperone n=1 Tax=Trinickia terrae TaxID=2571161 RepID=UPI00146F2D22|nr:lipase secretion chaperone [Trinickia terrae]
MNLRSLTSGIATAAVGAAAAFGIYQRFSNPPAQTPPAASTGVAATAGVTPPAVANAAVATGAAALEGATAPRLPLDAEGHLAHVRGVRDFFDYFLTARSQLSDTALDARVKAAIHTQLARKPAEAEATQLWARYDAYLSALDKLKTNDKTEPPAAATLDFDAIARSIDQRAQLASEKLGEWADVFFKDDLAEQRYALARARIMADTSLSAAEKVSRLEALEQSLPAARREALARERRDDAVRQGIQQALQQGDSPEAARAAAAQFGPQAAERAAHFAQEERDFRDRYAQYAGQRKQIDAQSLAPEDRERQLTQLRQQYFSDPANARRAAAFDGS